MAVKKMRKRFFGRLFGDRRGTAEIVGSVMFLVILLFVFTNVYLWHDTASREMDGVLAEKLNSPVSIDVDKSDEGWLVITNNGGFEVGLSHLWFIVGEGSSSEHFYVNLEPFDIRVAAGDEFRFQLIFTDDDIEFNSDGSVRLDMMNGDFLVWHPVPDQSVRCKIVTTLGNMAACTYEP